MKEMPATGYHHDRQTLRTRPVHHRSKRHRVVLLTVNDQGFVMQRLRHIRNRQSLSCSAYKNNFLDVTFFPQGLNGMTRHKRTKRKPCNCQLTRGCHLFHHRQEISGFASACIVQALRRANATKIKSRYGPTTLYESARQRLHHFVVHRSAKKRMGVRHHGNTTCSAFGLV